MSTSEGKLSALDQASSVQSLKEAIRHGISASSPEALASTLESLLPHLPEHEATALSNALHTWKIALADLAQTAPNQKEARPDASPLKDGAS